MKTNKSEHKKKRVKKGTIKKVSGNEKKTRLLKTQKEEQLRTANAKARMLDALYRTYGVVTPALNFAKVGRTIYYKWLKEDEEFREKTRIANDISLDHSEYELVKQINKGNITAIIFHLKTKGKGRGYVEGSEIDVKVSKKELDLSKLSDKELDEIEQKLLKAKQ